jgi:hypothetical protein
MNIIITNTNQEGINCIANIKANNKREFIEKFEKIKTLSNQVKKFQEVETLSIMDIIYHIEDSIVDGNGSYSMTAYLSKNGELKEVDLRKIFKQKEKRQFATGETSLRNKWNRYLNEYEVKHGDFDHFWNNDAVTKMKEKNPLLKEFLDYKFDFPKEANMIKKLEAFLKEKNIDLDDYIDRKAEPNIFLDDLFGFFMVRNPYFKI